jgi:hypothetical protein
MIQKIVLLGILTCSLLVGCSYMNPIGPLLQIGVYWLQGEAHKYYNTDQQTIIGAVKSSLAKLDLVILDEYNRDNYYWIKASDRASVSLGSREATFKIKIREVKERITKLSIRINTFGDREYAELIYRKVDVYPGVIQFHTVEELNTAYERRRR